MVPSPLHPTVRNAALVALAALFAITSKVGAITPREPDPALQGLAPSQCLVYVQNFGMTAPNPQSSNQTEQLAAEPDVQAFVQAVEQVMVQGMQKLAAEEKRPGAELDAASVEMIFDWSKYVATHPSLFYLAELELDPDGMPTEVDAGLVFRLDERIDQARQRILEAQAKVPPDGVRSMELAGESVTELRLGPNVPPIYWTIDNAYLYVTMGGDSMQRLLERRGRSAPAWLEEAKNRVAIPRRWLMSYVDAAALERRLRNFESFDPQQLWSALGMDDVTTIELSTGLDARGCLTRARIGLKAFEGIFSMLPEQPLQLADLKQVPENAQVAFVSRLDAERVLDTVRQLAATIEPRAAGRIEMGLAQAAQTTGVRIREDLLQSLGDTLTVYQTGGAMLFFPEIVIRVKAKDSAKLQAANTRLTALAKQGLAANAEQGKAIEIAQTTIGDVEANYLKGLPIAATWAVSKDAVLFATSPQTLKTHLAAASDDKSLGDVPQVATLFSVSDGPLAIAYNNTPASLRTMYPTLQMIANMGAGQLAQHGINFDTSTIPSLETLIAHIEPSVSSIHRGDDGIELITHETLPQSSVSALGTPTLVALLLPAVQAARAAARRNQSMNNVKHLTLALLNYESAYKRLPPLAVPLDDENDDRVGLSWRVQLLPFLGEDALYRQFRLNEPWDSEHNLKLVEKMPLAYRSPASAAPPGLTTYLAVRGEGSVLQANKEGTRLSEVTDGSSNTVWLVEADDSRAVIWTKPEDYRWNPRKLTQDLGGAHYNVFPAGFLDGRVQAIAKDVDPVVLKALFTRNGGEVVELND